VPTLLIVVLLIAFLSPLGIAGQKKPQPQVKIICPRPRPELVLQVRPRYPKEAKESGIERRVSLRCIIRRDGSVGEIDVREGKEPFVLAAKTAVAQWKYQPLVLNGVAVEFETTVDVIFEIPLQKNQT
jgi:TonB family protein